LAQGAAQSLKEARKAGQQYMAKTAKTSAAHVAVVGTGVIGASWAACFLAGGPGGIAHVLEHLGPPLESWWNDLGSVVLSTELNKRLADGVDDELAGTDLAALTRQRDALLLGLLEQKATIDAGRPSLLEVEVEPR
jgi:hypothetical protein